MINSVSALTCGGGFLRNWSLARMSWYLLRVRRSLCPMARFCTRRDVNFSSTWQGEQQADTQLADNRPFPVYRGNASR